MARPRTKTLIVIGIFLLFAFGLIYYSILPDLKEAYRMGVEQGRSQRP